MDKKDKNYPVSNEGFNSNNYLDEKQSNQIVVALEYDSVAPQEQEQQSHPNGQTLGKQRELNQFLAKTKKKTKKSTYKETVVNLFKAFVGSGVLALPFSFNQGGYLMSALIFGAIAILINYSQLVIMVPYILKIVVRLADEFKNKKEHISYRDMIAFSLGGNYISMCIFFIIVTQWGLIQIINQLQGCCISYMIFFMQFFEFAFYHSDDPTLQHELVYLAFAMCIIIPMTLIDNMSIFVKISALANVLVLITLTTVVGYAASQIYNDTQEYEDAKDEPVKMANISTVIGVAIYAFEAVGVLLTVQSSMEKKEKFKRLLQLVTGTAVGINIIFSMICSLGFGSKTRQIVLFSLPNDSLIVSFVQISYAVALAMSFPLQLLPAFHLVEYCIFFYLLKLFLAKIKQQWISDQTNGLETHITLGIPQFAVFLSFIGGGGGSALQFLFPLLAYVKVLWPKQTNKDNYCFALSMGLGISLGFYAMIASLIEMIMY